MKINYDYLNPESIQATLTPAEKDAYVDRDNSRKMHDEIMKKLTDNAKELVSDEEALRTYQYIADHGLAMDFEELMKARFQEGVTKNSITKALCEDRDWIFNTLGLNEDLMDADDVSGIYGLMQDLPQEECCICGEPFVGFGNNPYPICNDGLCCDNCNLTQVIPARLNMHRRPGLQKAIKLNAYLDSMNLANCDACHCDCPPEALTKTADGWLCKDCLEQFELTERCMKEGTNELPAIMQHGKMVMKNNPKCYAVLCAYRYKKHDIIPCEFEVFNSEEALRRKIDTIVNAYNKPAKDGRYLTAKESDFEFYIVYNHNKVEDYNTDDVVDTEEIRDEIVEAKKKKQELPYVGINTTKKQTTPILPDKCAPAAIDNFNKGFGGSDSSCGEASGGDGGGAMGEELEESADNQVALQYINDAGDIIARDYFDTEAEAREFATQLISSYEQDGSDNVYALYLSFADGNEEELWEFGGDVVEEELMENDEQYSNSISNAKTLTPMQIEKIDDVNKSRSNLDSDEFKDTIIEGIQRTSIILDKDLFYDTVDNLLE